MALCGSRPRRLGGDKNEVVIRSDGSPGYFASDIAYHYDKFIRRGFDWVIDVWGADHQGHVPRMKMMMNALGLDPEQLTLIIYQLVTLRRGGEIVRLSKTHRRHHHPARSGRRDRRGCAAFLPAGPLRQQSDGP